MLQGRLDCAFLIPRGDILACSHLPPSLNGNRLAPNNQLIPSVLPRQGKEDEGRNPQPHKAASLTHPSPLLWPWISSSSSGELGRPDYRRASAPTKSSTTTCLPPLCQTQIWNFARPARLAPRALQLASPGSADGSPSGNGWSAGCRIWNLGIFGRRRPPGHWICGFWHRRGGSRCGTPCIRSWGARQRVSCRSR